MNATSTKREINTSTTKRTTRNPCVCQCCNNTNTNCGKHKRATCAASNKFSCAKPFNAKWCKRSKPRWPNATQRDNETQTTNQIITIKYATITHYYPKNLPPGQSKQPVASATWCQRWHEHIFPTNATRCQSSCFSCARYLQAQSCVFHKLAKPPLRRAEGFEYALVKP